MMPERSKAQQELLLMLWSKMLKMMAAQKMLRKIGQRW